MVHIVYIVIIILIYFGAFGVGQKNAAAKSKKLVEEKDDQIRASLATFESLSQGMQKATREFKVINEKKDNTIIELENRNDHLERTLRNLTKGREPLSTDKVKEFQEINEHTYIAYELYETLCNSYQYLKLEDSMNTETGNEDQLNNFGIHYSIISQGVDETKKQFIGTIMKELLYKNTEEIRSDHMVVLRQDYLMLGALTMEKYIDLLASLPGKN